MIFETIRFANRRTSLSKGFLSRHSSAAARSDAWTCRHSETVPAPLLMLHNTRMHRSVARVVPRIVISSALCAWSISAQATLGGDSASILADATQLHGQVQPVQPAPGDTVSIRTDNGMTVREFLDSGGTVFAVSWSGPAVPDLAAVLGAYFGQYASALWLLQNAGRQRAIHVVTADLVVDTGGHLRAYSGRAYLPAAVPAGVALDTLR